MTKARKIAQYLVKNDVEIEVCDMNAICKQFGAKFEEIRDVLTEEYDS